MDDIIFEKDYRETESAEYDKWCDEVFDRAVNCGMLKAYSEAMDKIPKIIVPEDKKNYEYLLERCDAFVKQHRGYIKGIVDYHRWHAEINMFLPFAEFDDSEDLAFLKEIAEKSQTVCFSPDEEGGIRVHIFINYFEELMSAEHKSYIECDAIMQDKKLSALLGIPELSDEEKELALKMKGILDRIDEETRIDRTTAFRAVLDKMTKEPEENWSLHYMATLLEALLYFMLNEGNEKIDEEEHNEYKLVAYFSASGVTAKVAETLAEAIGADIFEIEPKVPYTEADLNWMDKKARSTIEMNDPASRPEIAVKRDNMKDYDTIFVGFPIWWYVAPTIINTFLESYDLTGKTIIPFATSGGSGIGKTNERLAPSCKGAKLMDGKVFKHNVGHKELAAWVDGLKL